MKYKEFKKTLQYRNYNRLQIFLRFLEYKIKRLLINLIIKFNLKISNSKVLIDLGSFKDNRYINYLIYALKNDFIFLYKEDKNSEKLFHRIGFLNFFKYTASNSKYVNKAKIKIQFNKQNLKKNELYINTNYFRFFYNNEQIDEKKY